MNATKGHLTLVPTPIGNLEDITLRALRVLKECDVIACEDTRHTGILLRHYKIEKPLFSCHEHNERQAAEMILRHLEKGNHVCLVSDAGLPGISDPGMIALRAARNAGYSYEILPGPSAGVLAFLYAGFDTENYRFYGFLPRKGKQRESYLREVDTASEAVVCYEAPHRIRQTLHEFSERWPNREFAVCRELTKKFEEVVCFRGADFSEITLTEKGEFVVVISPSVEETEEISWEEEITNLLREGWRSKEIAKRLSEHGKVSKNEIYAKCLEIQDKIGKAP